MDFGYPWAFWFLAAAAPVALLYLLRRRVRRSMVPYLRLWEALLDRARPAGTLRSIRRPLSLLLQLLLLGMLVTSAADPRGRGARSVLLLDASASMNAVEEGGRTRFETAKQLALHLIAQKSGSDEMMVITAAGTTEILLPFTANAAQLARAVDEAEPTVEAGSLDDALALARQVTAGRNVGTFYVLSDTAPRRRDDPRLVSIPVGQTDDNVGIVHFAARRIMGVTYLYVQIKNYSAKRRTVAFQVRREDGTRVAGFRSAVAPDGTFSRVFEVTGAGPFHLALTKPARDALAADDRATASVGARARQKVLLVSARQRAHFLGAALAAMDDVELVVATPEQYAAGPHPADVTIFNGLPVTAPPTGNVAYVNCTGPGLPVEILPRPLEPARVTDWDRTDPINRFISYGGLRIKTARRIRAPDGTRTLVSAEGGPLITLTEGSGFKAVYVGFDPFPGESDFPVREAFPLFLANLIGWFGAEPYTGSGETLASTESAIAPTARAGESVPTAATANLRLWLCLAAIGLLLLEWVLYHKGATE